MVPWHPPCALISLIFSSLDPETNCCYFEVVLVGFSSCHYSVLQLAFILNHFLCSCQGAGSSCRFFSSYCISVFVLRTLKAIQTRNAISTASDATLCVFVNPRLARLTRSATLLPCFIHPVGGVWTIDQFLDHRIDHRMKPSHFCVGLLLRKEVIQPHLPIRLPCYDFTPVIGLALDG